MRGWLSPLCALALVTAFASPALAGKGPRKSEVVWVAPDFASFDVRSIAMLPVATFDFNVDARRSTENAFGQSLRGTGYRWVSTLVTRDQIVLPALVDTPLNLEAAMLLVLTGMLPVSVSVAV